MAQLNVFMTEVEVNSLYSMMESHGCSQDEIELMFAHIQGDIREFNVSKEAMHVLLITLDYDACAAILTLFFEGKFSNKISSIHQRFKLDDHFNKRGSLEKAIEIATNLLHDIKRRVKDFKKKHPNGKVIGLNGSYRQDSNIDTCNRSNHNDPGIVGIDYRLYNDYFKGLIPGTDHDSLICVEGGDMDYIFKLLEIEYIPQCYADGDGEVGSSLGRKDLTVDNNRPKKLTNAIGECIKRHTMDKQGLVEYHFAKMQKRFPDAKFEMVFYDDKKKYLKSIKQTPLRENESVKTIHFEGWPDTEAPIPVEVFADISYKNSSVTLDVCL
jgi:hypothetical protein